MYSVDYWNALVEQLYYRTDNNLREYFFFWKILYLVIDKLSFVEQ